MKSAAQAFEQSAAYAERLALLLDSGVSVRDAFREAGAPGTAVRQALRASLRVGLRSGAPLGALLREQAHSLREAAASARSLDVAAAGPRATFRLMLALPGAGVVIGMLLGFDPLGTLTTTPVGVGCLVVGVALAVTGAVWGRRSVQTAVPENGRAGELLELVAVGLRGGLPTEGALSLAIEAAPHAVDEEQRVRAALSFARRSGAPVAALLVGEARVLRRVAHAESQMKVERIAAALLAPLGLCVLPSFLLLGVAPVVVAIVSATVTSM